VSADPAVEQLRRLTEIGRALTYTTTVEQVAELTTQRGAGLLDAAAAVLMLADDEGGLHVRAAHGVHADRVADAALGDDVTARLQALLAVPEDCLLAVPLVAGGAVTGLVAVALARPANAAEEWLLSALADQAAVALENARLTGEVRLEMEGRLRTSEGATSAIDRALATLAHDIRTPIGAIDGYCSNMEDAVYGPVTDKQRGALGRVRMSGRHLLSLLENVMDMARLNAGAVVVAAEPVRLANVAREAVELVTPAAAAKLQTLALSADDDLVVTGDAARIRQVLVNLLGNAVKFTPDGGSVTVTAVERCEDAARCAEVRVTDTGPGIAEAERAAIFAPYYRSLDAARHQGVGLGLAISAGLVAQMGGTLDVESAVGEGSSFTMRLPLLSVHAPANAPRR
jgi:phosphoserine phosphatase RsbU/P